MNMPLEVCEGRDPKGLYKLARAGKIKGPLKNFSFRYQCVNHVHYQFKKNIYEKEHSLKSEIED